MVQQLNIYIATCLTIIYIWNCISIKETLNLNNEKSNEVQTNNLYTYMKDPYIPDFRIGGYIPDKLHTADPNSHTNCSEQWVYLFT